MFCFCCLSVSCLHASLCGHRKSTNGITNGRYLLTLCLNTSGWCQTHKLVRKFLVCHLFEILVNLKFHWRALLRAAWWFLSVYFICMHPLSHFFCWTVVSCEALLSEPAVTVTDKDLFVWGARLGDFNSVLLFVFLEASVMLRLAFMFRASLPVLRQLINSGRRHVQTSSRYRYVSLPQLVCFNTVIHVLINLDVHMRATMRCILHPHYALLCFLNDRR